MLPTPARQSLLHLQPQAHPRALEDSFGGCASHGDTAGLGTPNPAQGHLEQPHSPVLSLSWSCIPGLPAGSRCGVSPTARPVQRGFVASSCSMGQDWPCSCHIHGCRWGELWPLGLGFAFKPHPVPSAELLGVQNGLLLELLQELLVRGRFLN